MNIKQLYHKVINKIIGEEPDAPVHIFNCTNLVWISNIKRKQIMFNEWKVYFTLNFCSGLEVEVYVYTDYEYSPLLYDIRKLFINAIGHSYLPLYSEELTRDKVSVKIKRKTSEHYE